MALTRRRLIAALATAGFPARTADSALKAVLRAIVAALERGETVHIRGFGTFRTRARRSYTAHTPTSRQAVQVPAKKVTRFRPGRALMALLNPEGVPEAAPRRARSRRARQARP